MVSFFGDSKAWCSHSLRERLNESTYLLPLLLPIVLFLWIWHSLLTRTLSLTAFAVFFILCVLALVYGRLFTKLTSLSLKTSDNFSLQFLCGYFLVNTTLFVLSLVTPFSIVINAFILTTCGLLLALFLPRRANDSPKPASYLPNLLCILLSGMGATLWCTDSLKPALSDGHVTIYQMWIDCFFHARQISAFSHSHGLRSLSDFRMSGAPVVPYHYASYATPAAVLALTDSSALDVFASFMLPFGILLTGVAAFSLAGSIWGIWPGLAATIAVVLLPDAYQQEFGNKYLSYHFLQQVAPTGLYGIPCVSLSWIFVLDACRSGKFASLFFAYAFTLITLIYSAFFFVANALLIMIYPCLFFSTVKASWRFIIAIFLAASFVLIVLLSQHSPNIPTLRFDGSGIKQYASALLISFDPGFLKSFFTRELGGQQYPTLVFQIYMAGMVVACAFGVWILAYGVVCLFTKARTEEKAFLLPLFVLINYIVMVLGLASDAKRIGGPNDLVHRPFVWAYFVIVAWTSAGIYALLIGNGPPRSTLARFFTVIFVFSSFVVPIVFARNTQTMAVWKGLDSYKTMDSVPSGLVEACQYIRRKSGAEDIIQDSENDAKLVITALAERQDYAVESLNGEYHYRVPEGLHQRLDEVAAFKQMEDTDKLNEFVRNQTISWYILRPSSVVAWPASFLEASVFNSGGFRVYHFTR